MRQEKKEQGSKGRRIGYFLPTHGIRVGPRDVVSAARVAFVKTLGMIHLGIFLGEQQTE